MDDEKLMKEAKSIRIHGGTQNIKTERKTCSKSMKRITTNCTVSGGY